MGVEVRIEVKFLNIPLLPPLKDDQEHGSHKYGRVGNVESGPVMEPGIEIEKIGHASLADAVIEVSQSSSDHEGQSGPDPGILSRRLPREDKKDDEDQDRGNDENEIPILPHSECRTRVLDISQIEEGQDLMGLTVEHIRFHEEFRDAVQGEYGEDRQERKNAQKNGHEMFRTQRSQISG